MSVVPVPAVVWDITYACPLRCVHCYSESGRRPTRQLAYAEQHRVLDALLTLRPRAIVFSGGEPLLVPGLPGLARRVVEAGVEAHLYTSGWHLRPDVLPDVLDVVHKITISVDGASATEHDRVRGRIGSFDQAMGALDLLDGQIGERRRDSRRAPTLGIDVTVLRTTFDGMADLCALVAARSSCLDFVFFGAVLPIGLASRADFAAAELPTEEQAAELRGEALAEALRPYAPGVQIHTSDNGMFQMHPDRLAAGEIPAMQVEPDGLVRAMPVYEGTVGSLLEEDAGVLWRRAVDRWRDPLVTGLLRSAVTPAGWAEATRRIDRHFGTRADRERIDRRPAYVLTGT